MKDRERAMEEARRVLAMGRVCDVTENVAGALLEWMAQGVEWTPVGDAGEVALWERHDRADELRAQKIQGTQKTECAGGERDE